MPAATNSLCVGPENVDEIFRMSLWKRLNSFSDDFSSPDCAPRNRSRSSADDRLSKYQRRRLRSFSRLVPTEPAGGRGPLGPYLRYLPGLHFVIAPPTAM